MSLHRWVAAVVTAAVLGSPGAVRAQASAGVHVSRDRALWHFENPSSYDTAELVPHHFEQDYTLDNTWFEARASYRAGVDWQTRLAATLPLDRLATDYDTFFDPGNVTWVSGTSGQARVHGIRFSQAVSLERTAGFTLSGGYRMRADLADFLAGDRTDRRNGILVSRLLVTSREFTNGQLHEVFISASRDWAISRRWDAKVTADVTPAAVNRLSIRLPDKYPGRTLVYQTTSAVTGAAFEVVGGSARVPVTLGIAASRSWAYSRTQWVRRSSVSLAVSAGRAW